MVINAESKPPATMAASKKKSCLSPLMILTIAKYSKPTNKRGKNAAKASYRFTLKKAEMKLITRNKITGKSNGELLSRNLPSATERKPKSRMNNEVAIIKAICFGKTNASVVLLKKRSGNTKRNALSTKRLMFSK